ncbi:papain fold toxin domain-containing protein [uncultured Nostoc sp.]|uniref:papain fold toxin domain-containing protein n=1 Tax=uncultured Nostoc sp. TaxID=340711 RepID=UPI0035CB8B2E
MTRASLHSQLSAIAAQFQIFECVPCAIVRRQFLIDQNISGKKISLFTGSTEAPFCNIYHERLRQNISINGRHEAITVEYVFFINSLSCKNDWLPLLNSILA